MELSENLKLRLDQASGGSQQDRLGRAPEPAADGDAAPTDEAESQMRKALGLLGETPRHRSDQDRVEQPGRLGDRFGGGLHRRRFVQDGDIPVTVLRREQTHDVPAQRGAVTAPAPTTNRLQRTEAALAAETAAREKAERTLADTQTVVRDLQTKIGHAELARTEAVEALRLERETTAQLRVEVGTWNERLQEARTRIVVAEEAANSRQAELADERQGRKAAEKALRVAEAAREAAEQIVRALSEESAAGRAGGASRRADTGRRSDTDPETVVVTSGRQRVQDLPAVEPEPVKWWLNAKPAGKRR